MLLPERFDAFLDQTVNLGQTRINILNNRVKAINNFLTNCTDEFGSRHVDLIPQGSYAHGTIINPVGTNDEFDADVLVEVEEDTTWEAREYVEKLYKSFQTSSRYASMAHRRTRCVLVDYANDFHLDSVPYLRRVNGNYITNRKENRFEITNPEGFNEWLDSKDRVTGGNLVKAIRLMKYLRDYKNTFSIASVLLTILLSDRVNYVALLQDPSCYDNAPATLKTLISALDDYLASEDEMPLISDPSCPGESFNHRWDEEQYENFKQKLSLYRTWVDEACDEVDGDRSVDKWVRLFGERFRQANVAVELSNKSAALTASVNEQRLDRDRSIPMAINPALEFRIRARATFKTGSIKRYTLAARGNQALKGMDIRFTLEACTVPEPFDLYWKVKNTGEEAQAAHQLRGQIVADDGTRTKRESTAYQGRHYVEAYAVRNGVCVAKDRQDVIVI